MTDVSVAAPSGSAPLPVSTDPLSTLESGVAQELVSTGLTDCKPFMESLTIAGALLALAASTAPLVLAESGVQGGRLGAIVAAVSAAAGIVGGTMAIIGRLRATAKLV